MLELIATILVLFVLALLLMAFAFMIGYNKAERDTTKRITKARERGGGDAYECGLSPVGI